MVGIKTDRGAVLAPLFCLCLIVAQTVVILFNILYGF